MCAAAVHVVRFEEEFAFQTKGNVSRQGYVRADRERNKKSIETRNI